ncbi:hypothetical protein GW17_00010300 [Ensete ventricosum]|nr:hypothetical protein GW17_00010300 [Ensete ventricosum]
MSISQPVSEFSVPNLFLSRRGNLTLTPDQWDPAGEVRDDLTIGPHGVAPAGGDKRAPGKIFWGRAPKKYLTELAGPPTMELGGRRHPPSALSSSSHPFGFPYLFFMNSKTEQLQCAYLSACMGRQSHVPINTIHFCPREPQRRAALVPRTPPPTPSALFIQLLICRQTPSVVFLVLATVMSRSTHPRCQGGQRADLTSRMSCRPFLTIELSRSSIFDKIASYIPPPLSTPIRTRRRRRRRERQGHLGLNMGYDPFEVSPGEDKIANA